MTEWNRRGFLKLGAFGAAGIAIENKKKALTTAHKPWNARVERTLRKFRNPLSSVCRMCPGRCGIIVFRDGDRVCQIQGAPGAPTNEGGICAKALAGLERLYDGERKLAPMRRRGPRGSGEWEPIGWDAALAEIGSRLAQPRGHRVLHLGQEENLVQELRDRLGWDHILVDQPLPGRPGPASGERWYGAPTLSPDAGRARTVYLFGTRPLDGRIEVPLARRLISARREGAEIHLFDALEGATGSLVTWHPVPAGTEWVVACGLARLLVEGGAYDPDDLGTRLADRPEAIRDALAPYTVEAVESATGISGSALTRLARRFSEGRPALALAEAGGAAEPVAALLNHLAGSVNAPGGIPTARGPFFVEPLRPTATAESWLKDLVGGATGADLYWVVEANPVYDSPRSEDVGRALADPSRVELLVAMDTHLTETASLADIFLPLATHFEAWGLVESCLPDGRPCLFLQQPATRPISEPPKLKDPATEQLGLFEPRPRALGESRSLSDVLLGLAKGDGGRIARFPDTKTYLGDLLRTSWGPGSFEALKRRGIWVSEESRLPNPVVRVSLAQAIPPGPGRDEDARLRLVGYVPSTFPRSFSNNRWGREIDHGARALIHPSTAKEIGVADRDWVVLRSAVGSARARVRVVAGIHPRTVALPDGFGHTAGGSVARAEAEPPPSPARTALVDRKGFLTNPLGLFRKEVEPGEPIWWAHEGPGVSLRALYPFQLSGEGVQSWGALSVEISRG